MTSPPAPPLVVVGGGVIGCAIAWEAARRGEAVIVVERDSPDRGASWAAAGMLSPLAEAERPGPFLELGLASLARFPRFVADLRDATGLDAAYAECGKLHLAFDEAQASKLHDAYRWQTDRGLEVEWLDRGGVRRLETGLSPAVHAALHVRLDHQVDNRILTRALWLAAERCGARMLRGESAAKLRMASAPPGGRGAAGVTGVELAGGQVLATNRVVVAAGCWSGGLGGLPRPLPVHPVPGQVLALESAPPPFRHTIMTERCYLVPRSDGRLLVGATTEPPRYLAHPTAGGVHRLLASALEAAPGLADACLVETWAGLRPATPDHMPILGEDADVAGLFYATGHYRNGILLAPITAEIVVDLVTGAEPVISVAPFRPDRFEEQGS